MNTRYKLITPLLLRACEATRPRRCLGVCFPRNALFWFCCLVFFLLQVLLRLVFNGNAGVAMV